MGKNKTASGTISKTINNVDYYLIVNVEYSNPSYKDWYESGEQSEIVNIDIVHIFVNNVEVNENDIDNVIIEELLDSEIIF